MGFTMGLNLVLLVAMVATNILSLYHLSSTPQSKPPAPPPVPDHTRLQPATAAAKPNKPTVPSDLLLYTHISPIASTCRDHPELLHRYMNYTPFSFCPLDADVAESFIIHGYHPELHRYMNYTPLSLSLSLLC